MYYERTNYLTFRRISDGRSPQSVFRLCRGNILENESTEYHSVIKVFSLKLLLKLKIFSRQTVFDEFLISRDSPPLPYFCKLITLEI